MTRSDMRPQFFYIMIGSDLKFFKIFMKWSDRIVSDFKIFYEIIESDRIGIKFFYEMIGSDLNFFM